jgi:hypothetical protein
MRITIGDHGKLTVPPVLLNNLRAIHRDRADGWLAKLPEMLASVLEELGVTIIPGDPGLVYNLVFFTRRASGEEIVVKATVPNDEQLPEEAGVHALSDPGIGPRLL